MWFLSSSTQNHAGSYGNYLKKSFWDPTCYNFNKKFNVKWISVFATRNIQASVEHPVEILINYGTEYWNRIRIMKSMTFVTSFFTSVDLDNGKEYWL